MPKVKGRNVSNLAALGWEWTGESGTRYQLVQLRGVPGSPTWHACRPGPGPGGTGGTWMGMGRIADRWATDGTLKGFKAMVDRFMTEGDDDNGRHVGGVAGH